MKETQGADRQATSMRLIRRCEKNMDRCPLTSCLRCKDYEPQTWS